MNVDLLVEKGFCKVSYLLVQRYFCEDIFSSSLKKLYLCRDILYILTFIYGSNTETVCTNQCLCNAKWGCTWHLGAVGAVCYGGEFYLWYTLNGEFYDDALHTDNSIPADKEISQGGGTNRGIYHYSGIFAHAPDHDLRFYMGGYRSVYLPVVC
jgi:hypothetical protein